jgi:hypothetical protein
MNYHNKKFRTLESSGNGAVTSDTLFEYKQVGNIVTARYCGGEIVSGHLIGIVAKNGCIEMRYHQVNEKNELMTGCCFSKPEVMPNGKIRLHESWKWTSGDASSGTSVLEEQ